jgi:hypothetical protein
VAPSRFRKTLARFALALQLPFFEMGALSDRLVSSTPE